MRTQVTSKNWRIAMNVSHGPDINAISCPICMSACSIPSESEFRCDCGASFTTRPASDGKGIVVNCRSDNADFHTNKRLLGQDLFMVIRPNTDSEWLVTELYGGVTSVELFLSSSLRGANIWMKV